MQFFNLQDYSRLTCGNGAVDTLEEGEGKGGVGKEMEHRS